jgi:glycosyltransferase involved in cell wall biosynthesis
VLVSCICVCHDKPDVIPEAVGSILGQTHADWEALVVDSGVLYDAGYYERFAWRADRRVRLIRSPETERTRRTRAMAPWCFNECFRRGLVRGDLVMYLCDDDVLYPHAFETFVSYCSRNPQARAMYASQDVGVIYPNGWHAIVGERRATRPGGRACGGRRMDCEVDYLQVCHKTEVLRLFPDDEYWPEAKDTEEHADGLFMERLGTYVPIHPIDVKVSQNRRTARSIFTPLPALALVDCVANGIPILPSREGEVAAAEGEPPAGEMPLVTVSLACHDQGAALPAALAALAGQTYPNLEVLVIDDGSRNPASAEVFEAMRARYPRFRFLRQSRAGIAATRNRGLAEARGTYFIPLEAEHLACPDMVERLVARARANPRLSAVTCYLLAAAGLPPRERLKNVYGHALFHTADFRAVGGYDTGPEASATDWSAFFKLVNAGRQIDLLPEHLLHTLAEPSASHPFFALDRELAAERVALWTALAGQQRRLEQLTRENQALRARLGLLRYRIADHLNVLCARVPLVRRTIKRLAAATTTCRVSAVPLTFSALSSASLSPRFQHSRLYFVSTSRRAARPRRRRNSASSTRREIASTSPCTTSGSGVCSGS